MGGGGAGGGQESRLRNAVGLASPSHKPIPILSFFQKNCGVCELQCIDPKTCKNGACTCPAPRECAAGAAQRTAVLASSVPRAQALRGEHGMSSYSTGDGGGKGDKVPVADCQLRCWVS